MVTSTWSDELWDFQRKNRTLVPKTVHTQLLESKKYFACEICEKSFANNQYKQQHLSLVHGEDKQFVCNVCNFSLSSENELTNHIKNIHGGQKNKNSYRIRNKVRWCRDSILQKKFWKFITHPCISTHTHAHTNQSAISGLKSIAH